MARKNFSTDRSSSRLVIASIIWNKKGKVVKILNLASYALCNKEQESICHIIAIRSRISTELNPILRKIKSNLFYAGWGAYMSPLWFLEKKSFLPNSFCIPKQLPKIGLHTEKNRFLHQKPKNGVRFKIAEWDMLEEFHQYFAFFTSSHYNSFS